MDTNYRSEITAEWTVRAHLTIKRPAPAAVVATSHGESSLQHVTDGHLQDNDSVTPDRQASESRNLYACDNPIRVVYKWCSDESKPSDAFNGSNIQSYGSFQQGNFLVPEPETHATPQRMNDNFHSVGLPPASDSGVSTSTTNVSPNKSVFNPRFRSTCNIILSASTDLLPKSNEINDDISTRCHTIYSDPEVIEHIDRCSIFESIQFLVV